jgi:hypothetical protein
MNRHAISNLTRERVTDILFLSRRMCIYAAPIKSSSCPPRNYMPRKLAYSQLIGHHIGGGDEHHDCGSVGGGEHDADPLGRWSQYRTTQKQLARSRAHGGSAPKL